MSPKALKIFSDWYDTYKDPEKEKMTKTSALRLITDICQEGAFKEDDKRVTKLFGEYAKIDPAGETLEREEFL